MTITSFAKARAVLLPITEALAFLAFTAGACGAVAVLHFL